MLLVDWVSVAGNTIFLISYIVFVAHIYRSKSASGVSGLAIFMWLSGFSLLAGFFLDKWVHSGRLWELLFAGYYAAGSLLSVLGIIAWWRYKG